MTAIVHHRGLGQDGTDITIPTMPSCTCVNGTCLEDGNSCSSLFQTGGTASSGGGTSVPPGTGFNWNSLATQIINAGSRITGQLTNPLTHLAPGTYYQQTPYGTVVATAGAPNVGGALTAMTSSSMMPLLLVGGGLLVVMMMARK